MITNLYKWTSTRRLLLNLTLIRSCDECCHYCAEEEVAAECVIEWREKEWVVVIGSVTEDELINEVGKVEWCEP